ncbi:MAG: long-chain-fatty-acid--CoA ligase [Planctomycetota bacterium]|jgi:long-chain acyl-CoA synthetase
MEERPWHASYPEGVSRSVDYEELTLPQMAARAVERFGDHPAFTFKNRTITFREFGQDVARMTEALKRLGAGPNKTVGIQAPTLPQTVVAYHAALCTGARVCLTNPLYTPAEIEHQWVDAEVDVAVVADFLYDQKVAGIRSKLPVREYVILSIPEYLRFPLNLLAPLKLKKADPPLYAKVPKGPGIHFFKDCIQGSASQIDPGPSKPDDIAVLQYTGGTTGRSKGAMLTHRNLHVNVQQLRAWFAPVEEDREVILTCLPLFHVFGMTVAMNFGLEIGAHQILEANPRDPEALVKSIAKHRVTMFPGVPALFAAINKLPDLDRYDLSSIKGCFSGSAPLPNDTQRTFEEKTGGKIIEGFGMTETSPATHGNPLVGERKNGSIGLPFSDTDAKIVAVEDDSVEMPIGEPGHLLVKGPQVMKGYWKCPEATEEALAGGWMHTGDLATIDEDGFFRIVGRTKDMISVGGLKVYPDEVDDTLMEHPAIFEAATIGLPKESGNELVKSFIVLSPGESLTAEEVQAHCSKTLAPFKVPGEVEFIDELPRSSVMKILRRELRERELEKRG